MTQSPFHFADSLVTRVRELGHPLCVGLDPHLGAIPPAFRLGAMEPADPKTAEAVEHFVCTVLDRIEGRVAVVKPQIAFFEQLGWRGMRALDAVVKRAHERRLLVLLDAKRGDIGSTAEGYARAYLTEDAALPVDAITLNPYLGADSLEPFVTTASRCGRGLFVLVKTSNAGSGDLQNRTVDGAPLYAATARMCADFSDSLRGPITGWSSLGVVVGATYPEESERVREALPNSLFLVPGFGAQGGSARDAIRGFAPGPSGLEGGIVNSSRGILFPKDGDSESAAVWERAFDAALAKAIGGLSEAVAAS
jgi:orotidine-5'-phosphate decarboxylase